MELFILRSRLVTITSSLFKYCKYEDRIQIVTQCEEWWRLFLLLYPLKLIQLFQ